MFDFSVDPIAASLSVLSLLMALREQRRRSEVERPVQKKSRNSQIATIKLRLSNCIYEELHKARNSQIATW
jgi:hypothetical protein